MIDLHRLGAGRKLIKDVMEKGKSEKLSWSRQSQQHKLNKTQKNPHTRKSRLGKKL